MIEASRSASAAVHGRAGTLLPLAMGVLVAAAMASVDGQLVRAALLCAAAVAFWATGALAEHVTALLFFLLAVVFEVAPAEVVFSGFSSPALWLVFSGLVIGVAIRRTGLGERFASVFLAMAPARYGGILGALVAAGLLLAFVMPSSMGRVVLLLPLALAIAERTGLASGSAGRNALVLATALAAYLPSAGILPANIPNLILAAGAHALYDVTFTYADYLAACFPTVALGKALVILGVALAFGRAEVTRAPPRAPLAPAGAEQRRLALLLGAAMALWATDFLHGVNPAWVGLAAALLCLIPPLAVVPAKSFNEDVAWAALFHTAGIIGLGAVVAASGLGAPLGRWLVELAPFVDGQPLWNFVVVTTLFTAVCLVTTTPGLPAVLTPLAGAVAEASGLPLRSVLLAQTLAFSTMIFPYQGAPLVFAFHAAGIGLGPAVRFLGAVTLASLLVLTPLTYLWWRAIGLVP
jgi:di/tricarboxylate transporter